MATFLTCEQVTACFLCTAHHQGTGKICHADPETGISYIMSTPVRWGKCEMVQFALTANTVVFFLCFLASVILVSSAMKVRSKDQAEERDGAVGDAASVERAEVIQMIAKK